ncbi:MAG: lysophospholipid acyltransferase family protein [Planctomycetaceae bacterium]
MPSLLVTDSKYEFVPPHEGRIWPRILSWLAPGYLRRKYAVTEVEVRGAESLKQLHDQGHGILLAPNHCRMSDAIVLQSLSRQAELPFYVMASSHLFRGEKSLAWVLRRLGAFSVNREGIDRQALQKAIDILLEGLRPLVIFPEGALSQANDRLNALQEGVSFVARSAASKLEKSDNATEGFKRKVLIVPVAIRYLYRGNIEATAGDILSSIERRLSWKPFQSEDLVTRIYRVGNALLGLKELEFLGSTQSGELSDRLNHLMNHLLVPLETEWLNGPRDGSVIGRVKELRKAILPAMIDGELSPEEMNRRWKQLDDASFAQSLSLYPPQYVAGRPSVDRILETVERFNEHLNGDESAHGPMKAVVQVGQPIEVSAKRDRSVAGDPVMEAIERALNELLSQTASESPLYSASASIRADVHNVDTPDRLSR